MFEFLTDLSKFDLQNSLGFVIFYGIPVIGIFALDNFINFYIKVFSEKKLEYEPVIRWINSYGAAILFSLVSGFITSDFINERFRLDAFVGFTILTAILLKCKVTFHNLFKK